MTTLVGTQNAFSDALKSLLELDYDAIEAYEKAIERVTNPFYKSKFTEFKSDHERHIQELSALLRLHNIKAATGPDAKQWLTKGRVALAQLFGDHAILRAMLVNVDDTHSAYAHINRREDLWTDARDIVSRGWIDEKRHKVWIREALAA